MENPKVLILDAPFNGLDKERVKEMREYLLEWKDAGKTILLSSHSAENIKALCDNVYKMMISRNHEWSCQQNSGIVL